MYIVDEFADIVAKVSESMTEQLQIVKPSITGVHYLVGHYTEIQRRLIDKDGSRTEKYKKYPLIALFQDFVERRNPESGFYAECTLQLIIAYYTESEDYTEDRYEKVFKPILYPIYKELMGQIEKNKNIVENKDNASHEKIDRPHWGAPGKYGNEGYIFTDALDAIELRNLKLSFDIKKCK
jgi:hypothetical protein